MFCRKVVIFLEKKYVITHNGKEGVLPDLVHIMMQIKGVRIDFINEKEIRILIDAAYPSSYKEVCECCIGRRSSLSHEPRMEMFDGEKRLCWVVYAYFHLTDPSFYRPEYYELIRVA